MKGNNNLLSIVSTYATDRLIDAASMKIIRQQRGGPALYLLRACKDLGLSPEMFTGEELLVELLIKNRDEFGSIKEKHKPEQLPQLKTEATIVSTILDEWDLSGARQYKGQLFVDIQGYVRDGSDFGKKKAFDNIKKLTPFVYCLKGNVIEINMLPKEIVEDQKRNRMVMITDGKNGVEIYHKGSFYKAKPVTIAHPKNTIGAGDTFFANFVYQFITTENIELAARFALDKTNAFLKKIK